MKSRRDKIKDIFQKMHLEKVLQAFLKNGGTISCDMVLYPSNKTSFREDITTTAIDILSESSDGRRLVLKKIQEQRRRQCACPCLA